MGRFDALVALEEDKEKKTSLLANQQTSKLVKKETSKLANQLTSKEANQQASKPVNSQTSNQTLTTKEKKKYGTYLREDSILEIQIYAAQTQKKDHEVLQDAVDFYMKHHKKQFASKLANQQASKLLV